jgi:hypothetical protein
MNALRKLILVFCLITWTLSCDHAKGGPIDFLERVAHSIAHPHRKAVAQRPARKSSAKSTTAEQANKSAGETVDDTSATKGAQPGAQASKAAPERAASGVPAAQVARADLPYGVPVPNRAGFVISPYSPNGGYVDVRGYPSGTAVKDPYTGKVFLIP